MEEGCFFNIGDLIGDYKVIKTLKTGLSGDVYLVKHQMLQLQSVMRIILSARQQQNEQEFLHRMQSVYTIRHPNIAGITYFARLKEKDFSYVCSEYVEGITVSEYMKSNPAGMAISQALDIIQKMAAALCEISSRGLAHYNIRPTNIFLTAEHGVKLTDIESASSNKPFSIAEAAASAPEQLPPVESLPYYAPDNDQIETADIRYDIYSLGMVLYFMLAGKLPFHSTQSILLIGEILYAELPAPGTIRKELPASLDKFVLRMIAKKPENRPQTPELLLQELSALQQELSGNAAASPETEESGKKVSAKPSAVPPKTGIPKLQLRMPVVTPKVSAEQAKTVVSAPSPQNAKPQRATPPPKSPPSVSAPQQEVAAVSPETAKGNAPDLAIPDMEDYGDTKGNEELLIHEADETQYQRTPFSWKNLPAMIGFICSKLFETTQISLKEFYPVIFLCIFGYAIVWAGSSAEVASLIGGVLVKESNLTSFQAYRKLSASNDNRQKKNYLKVLAGEGDFNAIRLSVNHKNVREYIQELCRHNEPDAYLIAATLKMIYPDRSEKKDDFLPLLEKAADLGSIEAASFLQIWHQYGGDLKKAEKYEKICSAIMKEKNKEEQK